MTTETKIAAQLDDGHYEIEVRIHEKRLNSAPQQPAAVNEALVERIAALLYEEEHGEPWTVAGVEHPVPDRDYYRGLARKVAALATQQQPVEEGERDWLAETLDAMALEWAERFGGTSDAGNGGDDYLAEEVDVLEVGSVDELRAEIKKLRAIAGCAYQMAGIHDAPEVWLDRLSEAANGGPLPDPDTIIDELLPYRPKAKRGAEAKAQELEEEIEKLRAELDEWKDVAEAHAIAADEAEDHADELAKALAELITWIPSADTYRRLGFDPETPMLALKRAKLALGSMGGPHND